MLRSEGSLRLIVVVFKKMYDLVFEPYVVLRALNYPEMWHRGLLLFL